MPDMLLEMACPGPVCGVDEAGRGPWAGPVSAGAVILDPMRVPQGLDDSKKLTAKAREALEVEIKQHAVAWGVGFASVQEIAELNILHAAGLAMCRAIEAMAVKPAFALVDGNYRFKLPCDVKIDTALFMIRPSPGFLRFAHGDIASKMVAVGNRVTLSRWRGPLRRTIICKACVAKLQRASCLLQQSFLHS